MATPGQDRFGNQFGVTATAVTPVTGSETLPTNFLASSTAAGISDPKAVPRNTPVPDQSLAFEPNVGQTDPTVRFMSRGPGYSLFLTSQEAVLSLDGPAFPAAGSTTEAPAAIPAVLHMHLDGANPAASVTGLDPQPGRINYFLGNDPSHWHTGIPTFGRVAYQDLYPGIGLVFYGNRGQLEYDFVLAPGADPTAVRLSFSGAEHLGIDAQGNLVIQVGGGTVQLHQPVLYQDVNGVRHEVTGGFILSDRDHVSFAVGAYDPGRPLVIDPTLTYSTFQGGSLSDEGHGIAADGTGKFYVTGLVTSPDFQFTVPGQGVRGNGDVFVSEFDPTLSGQSSLVYSTFIGGSQLDEGLGIAVDNHGDAYVTGFTRSPDFPVSINPPPLQRYIPNQDAFVAILSPGGTNLLFSTFLGGSNIDSGNAITVDPRGNIYVAGTTALPKIPFAQTGYQQNLMGVQNAFFTKLNPFGFGVVYFSYLGAGEGQSGDSGNGVAVDPSGNAYVTGSTQSPDFPTAGNPVQMTFAGIQDAFVAEFDPTMIGQLSLVYSTFLGAGEGFAGDSGNAIAVDSQGNAHVTGSTQSSDFPTTPDASQTTLNGMQNAFFTELNADGSNLIYSTFLGGENEDAGYGIAVGPGGDVFVTGSTTSTLFPTLENPIQPNLLGSQAAFLTEWRSRDTSLTLVYSTFLGGSQDDAGLALALSPVSVTDGPCGPDGQICAEPGVTGWSESSDYPTTPNAYQPGLAGTRNVTVSEVGGCPCMPSISSASRAGTQVTLTWDDTCPDFATGYAFSYQSPDGTWTAESPITPPQDAPPYTYTFTVPDGTTPYTVKLNGTNGCCRQSDDSNYVSV